MSSPAPLKPVGGRTFSDLLAVLDAPRERDWLFEGAIEGRPITVWTGPEKRGKSWIWIDAAIATVTGGAWLGAFQCRRPGPVIYLDSEYGPEEFTRRLVRLCRGRLKDPRDVIPHIYHYFSYDLLLAKNDQALTWAKAQARLIQPSLIVIDPWRNHLPGDENSVKDTVAAMREIAVLRADSKAAVTALHHLNKSGDASGSRSLQSRGDLIVEGSDADEPVYEAKGRTLRKVDPISRKFSVVVRHVNDDDDEKASTSVRVKFLDGKSATTVPVMGASAGKILGALRGNEGPLGVNAIKRLSKVTNSDVLSTELAKLAQAKLVSEVDGKWQATTPKKTAEAAPQSGPGEESQ